MKKTFKLFFLILVPVLLGSCGGRISVHDLQCEYLTEPLAIDNTVPYLSWKMASSRQGVWSGAYQVLVASSPDKLNENAADLWNSGKVDAQNEIRARYAGSPLKSKDVAWWKVRVWNQDGKVSRWKKRAAANLGIRILLSFAHWLLSTFSHAAVIEGLTFSR